MIKSPVVRRALPYLLILIAISGGTLFFRLGSLPLSGADEPRYARIAQEMLEQRSRATPLLEGKPWLEKPPLYYWITAPAYSLFKISEASARLGPALCALITALTIFWLGSRLWSRQAGFLGATILLTSIGFIGFGRSATTDMPFTCSLTLSMAILLMGARPSLPNHEWGWKILFAYIFLGLAVLGKGPVAFILAAGIGLCVWFFDERGIVLHRWRVVPGLIVAGLVSIPWFWLVFRENGFGFISTFFINHNLARYITGVHHHSQPVWYYVPVLVALLFPWSGWLPTLISKSPRAALRRWREWNPGMVFLVCWFLVPVIFFSISGSKLAGYILPSFPPLALILGIRISEKIESSGLRTTGWLHLILSAALAIAAPIMFRKEYGSVETGLIISTAVLVPALFSIVFELKGKWLHSFGAAAAQGILIVLVLAQFAFPVLGAYHSTREIAGRALEARKAGEPIVTYRFFHHSLHYYTGYQVAGKLDDAEALVQFARKNPGTLVVTNVSGMEQIFRISDLSTSPLAAQGNFRLLRVAERLTTKDTK